MTAYLAVLGWLVAWACWQKAQAEQAIRQTRDRQLATVNDEWRAAVDRVLTDKAEADAEIDRGLWFRCLPANASADRKYGSVN